MSAKTYPRPDGEMPLGTERCPLCKAPGGVAHEADCPWLLWSMYPADPEGGETK